MPQDSQELALKKSPSTKPIYIDFLINFYIDMFHFFFFYLND